MKHLFLKWCLANLVTFTVLFVALVYLYPQASTLSTIGKLIVMAIFCAYLLSSIYAATLSWKADNSIERLAALSSTDRPGIRRKLANINHRADHVSFWSNELPYLGLLGAATGIFIFMTGAGGATDLNHIKEVLASAQVGIGVAFAPTIAGIFFRIALNWQYHSIQHGVAFALKDYYQHEK